MGGIFGGGKKSSGPSAAELEQQRQDRIKARQDTQKARRAETLANRDRNLADASRRRKSRQQSLLTGDNATTDTLG